MATAALQAQSHSALSQSKLQLLSPGCYRGGSAGAATKHTTASQTSSVQRCPEHLPDCRGDMNGTGSEVPQDAVQALDVALKHSTALREDVETM